jgi:hypothetical protein
MSNMMDKIQIQDKKSSFKLVMVLAFVLVAISFLIKGVRVILNELSSYLLIKRGWFNGEKTTSF